MDLKIIITDTLHIPVLEPVDPILPPCAGYYMIGEKTELIGNAEEQESSEEYIINLWMKERHEVREKAGILKKTISQYDGNTIPTTEYSYDINGKLWRATLKFNHIKEE